MKNYLLLSAGLLLCISVYPVNKKDIKGDKKVDTSVYMDAKRPIDQRVEALLKQMTLREKIAQMDMVTGWDEKKAIGSGYIDFGSWIVDAGPEECNRLQAYSEKTRLKIPYMLGVDAAHGYALIKNKTVFPTSISMAATFNRDLVEQAAKASAKEIRSSGNNWIFAPSIDIVWDARWGRTGETYGEDPFLTSELVKHAVAGYQNNSNPQKRVAVSLKHMLGGGASIGGCNHAAAELSDRAVRTFFLPPFKAGIDAGAMTIMPGHNEVAGVPAHASKWLLTDVVKKELEFKGFYISDMGDVELLHVKHHVAENQKQAIEMAVNAGLDMHMRSSDIGKWTILLEELVKEKKVTMKRIDDAVRRILRVKFRLGLFESRYVAPEADVFVTPETRQLALQAARENIVLLKNADSLLPLDLKKYKRILVTGPNADNQSIMGDWSNFQPDNQITTILEGVRQAVGSESEVIYSNSGKIKGKVSKVQVSSTDSLLQQKVSKEGGAISDYSIADAVEKAKTANLAIIAVGGYGIRAEWGLRTYGESADRPSIDFYGRQEELIRAVHATGIPVIVVIVNGKPLNNEWTTKNIGTIVDVWEPGMCGGEALGELLVGKENFSGKLPISIPQSAGHVPMFYYQKQTRFHTGYGLGASRADDSPAFCFGHGLSYTTFEYSDLKLDSLYGANQDIKLSFRVKNTGKYSGKETTLVFVEDVVSSVVTPVAMLKGFEKISLQPGEEKEVSIIIPYSELGIWNIDMKYVVEPGKFNIKVGRSFNDIRLKQDFYIK